MPRRPPVMWPKPNLTLTAEELEDLRVALLSAHYAALDEERALRQQLELDHLQDERHRASTEEARAKAAMRAYRYHLLAERVMALQ